MRRSRPAGLAVAVVGALVLVAGCQSGTLGQPAPVFTRTNSTSAPAGSQIPTVLVTTTAPVMLEQATGVVVVGKPDAKVTVDLYEDLLCPVCGRFEQANWGAIDQALDAGTLRVRYHLLNLLDAESDPPGYSLLAANAALAVAVDKPDVFLSYHRSLFAKQPKENGPGYTRAQLVQLAGVLGASGNQFFSMVNSGHFNALIKQNLATASADPSLQQSTPSGSGFGTPTVVANGKIIDWNADPNWLTELTG